MLPYRLTLSNVCLGLKLPLASLQDDHLVHRGHGVFDTALVIDGYVYMLDRHIERLVNSAAHVRPPPSHST